MKKMILLCTIPFIIAAVFIVSIVCVQIGISYPFMTKKGNMSHVKDIAFDVMVKNGDVDVSSGALQINIHNQEGNTKHSFEYHSYDDSYENNQVVDNQSSQLSALANTPLNATYSSSNGEDDCKKVKEKVTSMPVFYDFMLYYGDTNVYISGEDNNTFDIKTKLNYVSNDQLQLYKESISCLMDEDEIYNDFEKSESYKYDTNEVIEQGSSVVAGEHKLEYYFMPFTNKYVNGQNMIYKIKLEKSGDYDISATSSEVLSLPLDRYYYGMVLENKHFYIVASVEDSLHVMEYTMEGELIKDTPLTSNEGVTRVRMITDKDYILIETDHQVFVYNMRKSILINTITKTATMKKNHIEDMIYKNDLLYALINTSDQQRLSYLKNRVEVKLQVVKNETLVYEGVQHIYDRVKIDQEQIQNIYIESVKFVRDTV